MDKLKILSFYQKNKKLKGVTLLELIVTIGIISILSSLLIVNSSLIDNSIEKKELKQLERTINNTRNYSIVSRQSQNIEFDFENNSYTSTADGNICKLKVLTLNKEGSNLDSFKFTKTGSPSYKGAGTIKIIGKNKTYNISVTPVTGKVNLKDAHEKK